MAFDKTSWLAEWANYVEDAIARIPFWNTAYDRSSVQLSLGSMPNGESALVLTKQDGTTLKVAVGTILAGKPDGLAAPLGVVEFSELTNVATVTSRFVVSANNIPTQTPITPNNTVTLTEKHATLDRFDTITYVVATGLYGFVEGLASGSPEVPNTPDGQIKLAEIFRPVSGASSVIPVQLSEFYRTNGGVDLNREVIVLNGKNIHLRANPSRPLDSGDVITERNDGSEKYRIFSPPITNDQEILVRFDSDNTTIDRIVLAKELGEKIPYTLAGGLPTILFSANNRTKLFKNPRVAVYKTVLNGDGTQTESEVLGITPFINRTTATNVITSITFDAFIDSDGYIILY